MTTNFLKHYVLQGETLMMLSHVNVVTFFGTIVPTGSADNGFYNRGLLLEVADLSLHDGKHS